MVLISSFLTSNQSNETQRMHFFKYVFVTKTMNKSFGTSERKEKSMHF